MKITLCFAILAISLTACITPTLPSSMTAIPNFSSTTTHATPTATPNPTATPTVTPTTSPTATPTATPSSSYVVDVVAGYGGTLGYSLDKGKNYQILNYGEDSDDCWLWRDLVYGNGLWVAVSYTGGFGSIITSPDGVHWRHYESSRGAESIAYGNGKFIADSFTSTDGYNFTFRNISASVGGHAAIAYVGGNWVISGDQNGIAYGTDGTNFSTVYANYTGTQYNSGIYQFAVNGNTIVGIGRQRIAFSTNAGVSWSSYETSTQNFAPFDANSNLRSVVWDGNEFVIYGGDGMYAATTTIWKSTTGTTWTAVTGNTPSFVGGSLLTGFFALNNGTDTNVANWSYSANGLSWTAATSLNFSPAVQSYGINKWVGGTAYSNPNTTPTLPANVQYTHSQLTAAGCGIPPGR